MVWTPLRTREDYRKLHQGLDDAITAYYESGCEMWQCNELCMAAYRLLAYINSEVNSLERCVAKKYIPSVTDAIMEYYGNTSDSYQAEVDSLEVLSRAAYKAIVENKREYTLVG